MMLALGAMYFWGSDASVDMLVSKGQCIVSSVAMLAYEGLSAFRIGYDLVHVLSLPAFALSAAAV